jgi:hypothetical protein
VARITYVSADYEETLPVFGAVLFVHLNNNGSVCINLESKADDPAFDVLRDDKRLFAVKADTDGNSIYWPEGPRLTFDEIMEMLREDGGGSG